MCFQGIGTHGSADLKSVAFYPEHKNKDLIRSLNQE